MTYEHVYLITHFLISILQFFFSHHNCYTLLFTESEMHISDLDDPILPPPLKIAELQQSDNAPPQTAVTPSVTLPSFPGTSLSRRDQPQPALPQSEISPALDARIKGMHVCT